MRSLDRGSRLLLATLALGCATERTAIGAPREAVTACATHYTEAQSAREKRSLSVAREHLLGCASEACPAIMQKDCARWLDEVELAMPTVVLEIRGAKPGEVAVAVDGARVERAASGVSIRLDPGPHHFRFEARGYRTLEKDVIVYEGEKLRKLVFELTRHAELVPAPTAPAKSEPSRRDLGVPFYVAGGIGIAALVTGGVLGISAAADRPGLANACYSAAGCAQSDRDAFDERLLVADVVIGVGIVALATAAVLYFTAPQRTNVAASR